MLFLYHHLIVVIIEDQILSHDSRTLKMATIVNKTNQRRLFVVKAPVFWKISNLTFDWVTLICMMIHIHQWENFWAGQTFFANQKDINQTNQIFIKGKEKIELAK